MFCRWRNPVRPSRPTALCVSLTMVAAVGSVALSGCSNAPNPCTSTPLAGSGLTGAGFAPGTTGAGITAPGATGAGATGTVPRPTPRQAAATTVTLPTGEQIRVATVPGGGSSVLPVLPSGRTGSASSAGFVRFTVDADTYLIPDEAVPYLGSLLDPRLFDVSYLARAGYGSGVPVRVSYEGGGPPSLPGLHFTQSADGTADAVVSAPAAVALGHLLASHWQAGAAALPGIASITLAQRPGTPPLPAGLPVAPPSRVPGGLAYHTLTLKFTGMNGKPAPAVGIVQNVDDARLGTFIVDPVFPHHTLPLRGQPGPLSFSLPDGTYSLLFSVLTPKSGTVVGDNAALVAKPQVVIDSNQTITMDARTTVPYRAQVSPPVSAGVRVNMTDIWRGSVTGGACGGPLVADAMGLISESGAYGYTANQIRVSPTPPVTKGSFYFEANTYLDPYPGTVTHAASRYYLDFPDAGAVPASLNYAVPRQNLTTVHEQIHDQPPGIYGGSRSPSPGALVDVYPVIFHPWGDWVQMGAAGPYDNVEAGNRTDYWYTSDPRLSVWMNTFGRADCTGCASGSSWSIFGPHQTVRPGQQITETWNKWPLAPTAMVQYIQQDVVSAGLGHFEDYPPLLSAPAASRQDDNGVLELQAGDSDPTNQVEQFAGSSAITFYRDGKLAIAPGPAAFRTWPSGYYLPLLSQPATYQLDWSQGELPPASAGISTDWTFHSSPDDRAASLPKTEVCPVDPARSCSFLPLLFIGYDLPLNVYSQATAGQPIKIAFSVGYQRDEPPPAGVSATVSASFNDGKTWTRPQAATGLGHNTFSVTLSQPALTATTGFASLRVTAHDAAGNAVTQTVIRAYGLTG
jgi:hypothetical protein